MRFGLCPQVQKGAKWGEPSMKQMHRGALCMHFPELFESITAGQLSWIFLTAC